MEKKKYSICLGQVGEGSLQVAKPTQAWGVRFSPVHPVHLFRQWGPNTPQLSTKL